MFGQNFTKLQIVIRDLKNHKRGHKKEILVNCGILAILITLIVFGIILFARACNRKPIEISTQREINIPIFPTTLPLEEKEQLVFETLTSAGYSVAGACGIMGNIAVESPNYDPTAVGPGGGPYGLFQWTGVGRRKHKLYSWCQDHNVASDSIEGQLAFAIYELSGGDSIAVRMDDYLRITDDAYTACAEFAAGFERCIADTDNGCGTYTGALYPEFYGKPYQGLNKRINAAMNYYERFKSAPPKLQVYTTEDGNNNNSAENTTVVNISL